MFKLKPYDCRVLKNIDYKSLEMEYIKFLINADINRLKYNFNKVNGYDILFILGRDDEKELPFTQQPIILEDKKTVILDLRRFAKKNISENLEDNFSNNTEAQYAITKTIYNIKLLEDPDSINVLINSIALTYTSWITGILIQLYNLDVTEKTKVELAIMYSFFKSYYKNILKKEDIDDIDIYSKIKKVNGYGLNLQAIKVFLTNVIEPETFDDLVYNIKTVSNSIKLKNLDKSILYNSLVNTWMGVNKFEETYMATEHIPTLIAMINIAIDNNFYAKSRFGKILDLNKRKIDVNKFISIVKREIKEVGPYLLA